MAGYPENPGAAKLVSFPGSYHSRGATFTYADGHSEGKTWKDPRTTPPLDYNKQLGLNVPSPNNPDVKWLQEHSTRKN
jgi:prepilin-type processing-associated H-X9-DG protein